MSCYGCNRKYGIFAKEYGCPNCGYSYCGKCLKRPIEVPRHGNRILNVCLICYDKLSKIQAFADSQKVVDCDALPGELVTRQSLANRNRMSSQMGAVDALFDNVLPSGELAAVLSPTCPAESGPDRAGADRAGSQDIDENLDSAINKRLQNLKSVGSTDDEIRARLSNLSGMPHQKNYDKKDLLLSADQRTDQEKINDLLHQFVRESQMDQRVENDRNDAMSDIERRLQALRDAPIDDYGTEHDTVTSTTNTPSDNEEDGTDAFHLENIMKKYVVEAQLPGAANALDASATASNSVELPWCNICSDDAVYRCLDCDGDLFCAQCFRECHLDDEFREHAREKYTAPPKFKDNRF